MKHHEQYEEAMKRLSWRNIQQTRVKRQPAAIKRLQLWIMEHTGALS